MGVSLHLHQEVRTLLDQRSNMGISAVIFVPLAAIADRHRPRAENLQRIDVEQRGLIDRLHLEFTEEAVSPFDQNIDVVHNNALLIRAETQARDGMRIEWFLLVSFDRGGVGQGPAQAGHIPVAEFEVAPNTIAFSLLAVPSNSSEE